MASKYPSYRMVDGRTALGASYFNPIWRDLDLRLVTLEGLQVTWEGAIDEVRAFGLERINAGVQPLLDQLTVDVAEAQTLLDALPDDVALKSDLADPSGLQLTRVDGKLSAVTETIGGNISITTFARDGEGRIASVQRDYLGIRRTETFVRNPDGTLYGFSASEVPL